MIRQQRDLHDPPPPFMIARMPASRLAIAGSVLSIAYALLHVALMLRAESPAEDSRVVLLMHAGLGIGATIVLLRFQIAAVLGALCFIALTMAASALMTGPELAEISALRAARASGATLIGVLALALATRSTRQARFTHGLGRPRPDGRLATATAEPFRINPNSEPQRLLALAALRRRLIERTLGLTGPEAATAAYSLEARLTEKLAELDAQPSEHANTDRQLLAAGLIIAGKVSAFDLLHSTLTEPVDPMTLEALTLVTPLPGKLNGATEIAKWIKRRRHRLEWDASAERYQD